MGHGADLYVVSRRLGAAGSVAVAAPAVNEQAVRALKFSAALPDDLAHATVAEPLLDADGARRVLHEQRSRRFG